jgi:hypothetical protein
MDFEGFPLFQGSFADIQTQIDAINLQITTINAQIAALQASMTTVQSQTRKLNQGASSSNAPFGFVFAGPGYQNLTASMTFNPVAGLTIPLADLVDGATFRVKLYTSIQNNFAGTPNTLTIYLSQEAPGSFWYTNPGAAEILPVIATATNYVYTYEIVVKTVVGHVCFISAYQPVSNSTLYTDGTNLNPFSSYGGLTIFFQAAWGLTSSIANNLVIYGVTFERVCNTF